MRKRKLKHSQSNHHLITTSMREVNDLSRLFDEFPRLLTLAPVE